MRSYEFQMGNQCQDAPEEYARGEFRSRPASKGWLRSLAQSLEQSSRRVFFCKIFVVIRLLRNSLCEPKASAIQSSRSCEDCTDLPKFFCGSQYCTSPLLIQEKAVRYQLP